MLKLLGQKKMVDLDFDSNIDARHWKADCPIES